MSDALLPSAGGTPQKQPRNRPIHVSRALAGLVTNRSALHDPSYWLYGRFYGGQPDALLDGKNIEISPNLTWKRRPGISQFGTGSYPSKPLTAFGFYDASNDSIDIFVDTLTGVYLHNPSGDPTLIFQKSAGAGQTSFYQAGDILYFANGVDSQKYIDGTVYNWASDGPQNAPGLVINNIGAGTVSGFPWSASTEFTTFGLLKDTNGNSQQLIGINADSSNTANAVVGTSGVGEPIFSSNIGGTVSETRLTWQCQSTISVWQANSPYSDASNPGTLSSPVCIYDPGTGNIFIANGTGNSGGSRPNFAGVPLLGGTARDGAIKWFNIGQPQVWRPSFTYAQWGSNAGQTDNIAFVCSPTTPKAAGIGSPSTKPQTVFLQVQTQTQNTSNSTQTGPHWSTSFSQPTTRDGQLLWQYLGSATWTGATSYNAWEAGGTSFNVIYDGANFQVCITSGLSAGSAPSWQSSYGLVTTESTGVQWVCVGALISWAASTKWFLPPSGFSVPVKGVNPFGGAHVLDTNGNVEFVINNGKSSSSHPVWPTAVGGTVTESGSNLTWTCTALASTIKGGTALTWTQGYAYVFAWKARQSDDFFVANTPNGQPGALGAPIGSGTGGITTASPVVTMPTGANPGAQVQLSESWPTDLQYDTVVIYRCADGSQGGPFLELTEIACPAPVNGVYQGSWIFYDSFADSLLNPLIEGDVVGENAPPPSGLMNIAFHMGRMWGNVNNIVYASSGPDIPPDNGNGLEGWNASNNFPLQSAVSKLIPTQQGLLTFTTADIYNVAGGPSIGQFFPFVVSRGIGLLSPNAIEQIGGEIYLFSADRRLLSIVPGSGHTEIGLAIADKLAAFNPADVYLTEHANGNDPSCFYLGDGSTGWFRLNPHSYPDNTAVWSPFAAITGGCSMLISLQTTPGVRTLLVGGTNSGPLFKRDVSTNLDNGTTFHGFYEIGSIVLTHPGETAILNFLTMEFANQGNPQVGYLINEISGDWNRFSEFSYDPPLQYGTTLTPTSYSPRRFDFKQTVENSGDNPPSLLARHIQIRVDYPAENAANELLTFTINGALFTE